MQKGEQGYVLLSAIWMLVLAGAVVAWLMLRGLGAAEQSKAEGAILRNRLAMDAALATIVGDIVMNGSRSSWAKVPANGTLSVEGISVGIRLTNEADRIDLNNADPRAIDQALRASGLPGDERRAAFGGIAQQRSAGLRSLSDVRAALNTVEPSVACQFTYIPGGAVSANIGTTQNSRNQAVQSVQIMPGAVLRVQVSPTGGANENFLIRILGQSGRSYELIDRIDREIC